MIPKVFRRSSTFSSSLSRPEEKSDPRPVIWNSDNDVRDNELRRRIQKWIGESVRPEVYYDSSDGDESCPEHDRAEQQEILYHPDFADWSSLQTGKSSLGHQQSKAGETSLSDILDSAFSRLQFFRS